MRTWLVTLLLPLSLYAQARGGAPGGTPSAPPLPPPTPTADLAAMEGQVVNALSGTPLRKATVTANRQNNGPMAAGARSNYSATTDASGHFSFSGMEPGTYRVNADHNGYLNMQYNARRPGGPGTALDLGRAQKMTGVDFRLTPHGVIAGKVTDEDGDPLEGVQIQVMRIAYNQGRKQLQQNNGGNTNDLGEYRIYGILPGRIYLCAIYRGRRPMPPGEDSAQQEDYVTTFFPNATDVSAASAIEMGPGDQMEGLNLRLAKVHTVRVSGHVADNSVPPPAPADAGRIAAPGPPNAPIPPPPPNLNGRIQLRMLPRNALNPNGLFVNTAVKADGSFEFQSVAPGAYYLIASSNQGGRPGAHAVREAIDVGNNNVEGVNLAINPGPDVTGHVRYDGDPPQPLPSLSMRLMAHDPTMGVPLPPPAKVGDDGNFRFDDISPDLYYLAVTGIPQTLYVKSATSGNRDVLVSGIDLSNGAASVDILLGVNPPQVGGSVVNAETGQPASAVTVLLMPREKERQELNSFYYTTSTDQYGNFTFSRVTPGDYAIYAWEDVQYGQWFDPDWMKAYAGKGDTLSAKEGSPVTLKLTMIPMK